MSKFVIECPQCGNYAEASNFIFAKKHINCSCGNSIDVRADRMSSRACPHCGNMVVFDQAKGDKAYPDDDGGLEQQARSFPFC